MPLHLCCLSGTGMHVPVGFNLSQHSRDYNQTNKISGTVVISWGQSIGLDYREGR